MGLQCPAVPPRTVGICVELCSGNDDCENGEMCCSNGCGHKCLAPVGEDNFGI